MPKSGNKRVGTNGAGATSDDGKRRRQTVEHLFGTIKGWMGPQHFKMKTVKHVSTEMSLHVRLPSRFLHGQEPRRKLAIKLA